MRRSGRGAHVGNLAGSECPTILARPAPFDRACTEAGVCRPRRRRRIIRLLSIGCDRGVSKLARSHLSDEQDGSGCARRGRRRRGGRWRLLVRHSSARRRAIRCARRTPPQPRQSGRRSARRRRSRSEAVKVATAAMPQTITAVGSLRSDESITVRPEVAGRISAIQFHEGQRVAKGTTLVKLDPSINEAEVQQARANLKLAQIEIRARGRSREEQLHLGTGEGRGGEQPARRRSGAAARRGEARQDRDQGAVLGNHRPARRVDRRLREGRRRRRQPRVDRSAEGRFPRARDLSEAGAGRADAADSARRAARQDLSRARSSRSTRWSTQPDARSSSARSCATRTRRCGRACSRACASSPRTSRTRS